MPVFPTDAPIFSLVNTSQHHGSDTPGWKHLLVAGTVCRTGDLHLHKVFVDAVSRGAEGIEVAAMVEARDGSCAGKGTW